MKRKMGQLIILAAKEDIYASNEQVNMANLGSLRGGWKQVCEPRLKIDFNYVVLEMTLCHFEDQVYL